MKKKSALPIDSYLDEFKKRFLQTSSMVLSATPGAGKTTRVPVALSEMMEKQIWILEPRRVAAISAAARIAEENGWNLGAKVGYQVRFDKKYSEKTQILFLTEALLLRKLKSDPELSQVGAVILDEFHERSIHVDLALGALKELQDLSRPDLKILVMSATLFVQPLCEYLQTTAFLEVPGQIFPLEVKYDSQPFSLKTGYEFTERMWKLLQRARKENPQGDILCFLPGRGEIERLKQKIKETQPQISVYALHSQVPLEEQRHILRGHDEGTRIILATNIAESSLTIDSVRVVVDSGLVRLQQQNVKTGFESLQLSRISKASATQRAGRAARTGPGVVYRAWTAVEESSQKAFEVPEVQRVDLCESILLLASLGVSSPENFAWFQKPSMRTLDLAKDMLVTLEILTPQGRLTDLGQRLQQWPLHPRLGKLLALGEDAGLGDTVCELAAVLMESHRWRRSSTSHAEDDVADWIQEYRQLRPSSVAKTEEQLIRLLQKTKSTGRASSCQDLLFSVYKDRLCRRRGTGEAEGKMAGGRGVLLSQDSSVKKSDYYLAIEVREGKESAQSLVEGAVGLPTDFVESMLLPLAQNRTQLTWDEEAQKFWVMEGKEWNHLRIGPEKKRAARADELQEQMVDLLLSRWDHFVQKNESLSHFMSRLLFLNQHKNQPLFTDLQIRAALEQACFNETSMDVLENKDMTSFFILQLQPEQKNLLEKECPEFWRAPTGNRFRITYSLEQGASVQVRLQEVFGVTKNPQIAGVPLTFFLLAPNYRPVQVTRDIKSFWKNGYVDVRKEMRARYPKHAWPEDPLTAVPQAKGRSTR